MSGDGKELAIEAEAAEAVERLVRQVAQNVAVLLVEAVEAIRSTVANVTQRNAFFEAPEAIQTAPTTVVTGAVSLVTSVWGWVKRSKEER